MRGSEPTNRTWVGVRVRVRGRVTVTATVTVRVRSTLLGSRLGLY